MLPRLRRVAIVAAVLGLGSVPGLRAQGLIVDRHHPLPIARSYEVGEVSVDARVRDQVAEVRVSQTLHNPGSTQIEAEYLFPMPEEGAIRDFVLMVDGKELPGKLLPKDEARRIYEEIVRTKRDPALLEYMGRGLFRTSIFPIPPGADRKVTLRYSQICPKEGNVVEFAYPFSTQKFTSKPIQKLNLRLEIDGKDAIKSIYCPSHDATIDRVGENRATIRLEQRNIIPNSDFRIVYTLDEGALGASVLSIRPSEGEDGYFLLLASPRVKAADEKPRPKTVVFVLDRSGSMSGKKIDQARNALKFVLDNMRDEDSFNIIVYDDRVESFKPEIQRFSKESRADAARFVDNIQPGGSTNIDQALTSALDMIKDDDRPSYVLFLTDGLPTAGEMRETAISLHGREANKHHARFFAFGVGYDVNARLLDRLSSGNGGTSEYVKPDDDIEAHVSRFYGKLTRPVLTGLSVEMAGTDLNRTYPRDLPDLFEGGQIAWVGRYRQSGKTTVKLSGKVGGDRQSFEFPAELASPGHHSSYDFVESLWAVRRVGFLIDQIDLHGENRELTDELIALSKQYGILTPYTSFLADERVNLHASVENRRLAEDQLHLLTKLDGALGVNQRAGKAAYQNADRAAGIQKAEPGQLAASPAAPASNSLARAATGKPVAGRYGMGGSGGGMGGLGGGMGGASGPMVAGAKPSGKDFFGFKPSASYARVIDAEGREAIATNVRNVGRKTFFRKGDRWVDSTISAEADAKAVVIEQFGDDYFKLAAGQDAERNQYLTFEEPVTVDLGGKVYRIEQAKK